MKIDFSPRPRMTIFRTRVYLASKWPTLLKPVPEVNVSVTMVLRAVQRKFSGPSIILGHKLYIGYITVAQKLYNYREKQHSSSPPRNNIL